MRRPEAPQLPAFRRVALLGAVRGLPAGNTPRRAAHQFLQAEPRGQDVFVRFRLDGALNPELATKIESGLETAIRYDIRLYRHNAHWLWDDRMGTRQYRVAVTYDPVTREYVVVETMDGRPLQRSSHARLLRHGQAPRHGRGISSCSASPTTTGGPTSTSRCGRPSTPATSSRSSRWTPARRGSSPIASRSRCGLEALERDPAPPQGQPPHRRAGPRRPRRLVGRLRPRAARERDGAGHDHARPAPLRPLLHQHHADRRGALRALPHPAQDLARAAPGGARLAIQDEAARDLPRPDRDSDRPSVLHGDGPPPALHRPVVLDPVREVVVRARAVQDMAEKRIVDENQEKARALSRLPASSSPEALEQFRLRERLDSAEVYRGESRVAIAARAASVVAPLPAELLRMAAASGQETIKIEVLARRVAPLPRAHPGRRHGLGGRDPDRAGRGPRASTRSRPPGASTRSSRCRSPRSRRPTSRRFS